MRLHRRQRLSGYNLAVSEIHRKNPEILQIFSVHCDQCQRCAFGIFENCTNSGAMNLMEGAGTSKAFPCIFGLNFLAFDLSLICGLDALQLRLWGKEPFDRKPTGSEHLHIMKIQFQQNLNHPLRPSMSIQLFPFRISRHTILWDFPPIWSLFKLPLSISWIYLYWCCGELCCYGTQRPHFPRLDLLTQPLRVEVRPELKCNRP